MLELPALEFIGVVVEVRRLALALEAVPPNEGQVDLNVRRGVAATIATMRDHLATVAAQSAWVAADRLHRHLENGEQSLSFAQLRQQIADIESRFADHLSFIRLFVARPEQLALFGSPSELLGEPTASLFPSLWFDCEEAAKCLLVLRPTASVFHAMRMLEIAVRALAQRLQIPDPVRPSDRNWGKMLGAIKTQIDANFPPGKRLPHTEGTFLEEVYASLDAVKNPWRNATMHVEGVYGDAEAQFILLCTINLIQKMATGFDENGNDAPPSPLPMSAPATP